MKEGGSQEGMGQSSEGVIAMEVSSMRIDEEERREVVKEPRHGTRDRSVWNIKMKKWLMNDSNIARNSECKTVGVWTHGRCNGRQKSVHGM